MCFLSKTRLPWLRSASVWGSCTKGLGAQLLIFRVQTRNGTWMSTMGQQFRWRNSQCQYSTQSGLA